MIKYIPFLKSKRNEINAMGDLDSNVKQAICPFFDFPHRKDEGYSPEAFAKAVRDIAQGLKKHWGANAEFYFDDLNVSQKLIVDGMYQYAHILHALNELRVIPIVDLERIEHNDAVAQLKRSGVISSTAVAFRTQPIDFEDFEDSENKINNRLANIFNEFEHIDLVLDCGLCTGLSLVETARQIAAFAQKFCEVYSKVRRVVVTGSSIPPSSSDVLETNSECVVRRHELDIIRRVRDFHSIDLTIGDYATVSPLISEVNIAPKIMQRVMTARLTYTYQDFHYFIRGSSLRTDGYEQYFGLARTLCQQVFFRGASYSEGDQYFYEKSQCIGSNGAPGPVIKPSVVAHITYMVLDAKV